MDHDLHQGPVRRVFNELGNMLSIYQAEEMTRIESSFILMNLEAKNVPDIAYESVFPNRVKFSELLELAIKSVSGTLPKADKEELTRVFGEVSVEVIRGFYA